MRTAVLTARAALAIGREKLKAQHLAGSPGVQVCRRLTDLADTVLSDLILSAISDQEAGHTPSLVDSIAIVAHGGYGRKQLAPYSDLDVLLLHFSHSRDAATKLGARLLGDVPDVGLALGFSKGTPREVVTEALREPMLFTSLSESRLLLGNQELFDSYFDRLKRGAHRRKRSLLPEIELARQDERRQFGETVYLLEPNVKRSRGGLRDIQLLRWAGFCSHGLTDPDELQLHGALEKREQQAIRAATEFLLRIRNELHFHGDKSNDQLDRAEQVRLAATFGYTGEEGLLPVEQFMREYFRLTGDVRYIVTRFLANAERGPSLLTLLGSLFSHELDGDYRVGPSRITATRRGLAKLRTDVNEVMRLAEISNLYDKRIAHTTWEAVRQAVANMPDDISPETAEHFMALLSQPARLSEILRKLHELGVLERIIPQFAHARGLLQFNEYHKYTVDEHCLLAVRRATEFLADPGPLGNVYRRIRDKQILHLALLIHDLGKGHVEDHSELGRRMAAEIGPRLGLTTDQTELLKFLVHKHLVMAHLALWRDISEEAVVLQLAVEVGSPQVLRMLYILTAADLASVGPDVLNDWKIELLTNLFERTMEHLSGDQPVTSHERLDAARQAIREALSPELHADSPDRDWYNEQVGALAPAYLKQMPSDRAADELRRLRQLTPAEAIAWGTFLPDRGAIEYTVGTYESIVPGIFHRLAGALSGEGLEILFAQINTLPHGLVLDKFYVRDTDYSGPPPPDRIESVSRRLVESLQPEGSSRPVVRQVWQRKKTKANLSMLPVRVLLDNDTSDKATIVEVFAPDKTGLLYVITRTVFELGLSVVAAKIGTYLDQVVDVLYVTDAQSGEKIFDPPRLDEIRRRLVEAIESFEQE
ncbi:MAG: [protein-PII] uridylyltransferase [Planctomycetia bacterium]|nr:[protein-PII] uridylyltransferase [Planctomycetia bacterium]